MGGGNVHGVTCFSKIVKQLTNFPTWPPGNPPDQEPPPWFQLPPPLSATSSCSSNTSTCTIRHQHCSSAALKRPGLSPPPHQQDWRPNRRKCLRPTFPQTAPENCFVVNLKKNSERCISNLKKCVASGNLSWPLLSNLPPDDTWPEPDLTIFFCFFLFTLVPLQQDTQVSAVSQSQSAAIRLVEVAQLVVFGSSESSRSSPCRQCLSPCTHMILPQNQSPL